MGENSVDECTGVSSCKDETDFADYAVKNVSASLFKLISIDRKCGYITVLNKVFSLFAGFSVIKGAIGVNALISVLKKCMTQNIIGVVVLVVPNKRNYTAIAMLESIFSDGSSVRALEIVLCGPATKIVIGSHFDCFPFIK